MIVHKDILEQLTATGYTTYKIRNEKIIPENTMQKLHTNGVITTETLDKLCELLKCQPGDLLEFKPIEEKQSKAADLEPNPSQRLSYFSTHSCGSYRPAAL